MQNILAGKTPVRLFLRLFALSFVVFLVAAESEASQQQIIDPDFNVSIEHPSYPAGRGLTVAIDEGHSNFHTAGGRYKPFADLLAADGYRVVRWTGTFSPKALAGIDVLVVANARHADGMMAGNLPSYAFSEQECDDVSNWVRKGGALLLIADHAPFGDAAEQLAQHFGIVMGKKWAFDRADTGGITTELDFSSENGLLGKHPILRGRSQSEAVRHVRSYTGQSLVVPTGAIPLMKLSKTAREAVTPDDLGKEDAAVRGAGISGYGFHSHAPLGQAQGLAMQYGKGRVVALGEAGLFSAQIVRYADGRELKFGLNVPGTDDRQFALNTLHWLSGLLR